MTAPAFPLSKPSSDSMSSSSRAKSYKSLLERIRIGFADLGNGVYLHVPALVTWELVVQ